MAFSNLTKRYFTLFLLSYVVFAAFVGHAQAGMIDWVNRCCVKGKQKATNFRGRYEVCDKDDLDRRTFGNMMDRMACRIAERVCCIKHLQILACDRGKYQAFQGKSCARLHGYAGSDRYICCCDCCTLGIKARSTGASCDQLVLNDECKIIYKECCSGSQVTATPNFTDPALIRTQLPTSPAKQVGCISGSCQHICREDSSRKPVCYCYNGYFIASDKKSCLDVNECAMSTPVCLGHQQCVNTKGSYKCVQVATTVPPATTAVLSACSSIGYELVRGSCQDINECTRGISTCSRVQTCINTIGSYRCTCSRGYKVSGKLCVDKDECANREAQCPPGSTCRNLPGSYICSRPEKCPIGKRKTSGGCVDIDECASSSPCGSNLRCVNTDGSYRCVSCGNGFRAERNRCVDIDECADSSPCRSNVRCVNTAGSYRCVSCGNGFRAESNRCVDIDECAERRYRCESTEKCVNTPGSYRCAAVPKVCQNGFKNVAGKCVDIDECAERRYRCAITEKCVNTPGSYRCAAVPKVCKSGYKNVAGKCVDINECVEYNIRCPNGGQCKNDEGSYTCVKRCPNGFKLVNGQCKDLNECVEFKVRCPTGYVCSNLPGSYRCERANQCRRGYEYKNGRCVDINECTAGSFRCFAGQRCENVAGSYRCVSVANPCPRGHKRVNGKCVIADIDPCAGIKCSTGYECKLEDNTPVCKDIDECLKRPCKYDEQCVNKPGRHFCVCRRGYRRNQYTQRCEDINECRSGICEHGCVNMPPGSYTCSCQRGFQLDLDKRSCKDVDECLTQNPCQGRCTNIRGSFRCSCDSGFLLSEDNRSCRDINECETLTGSFKGCSHMCTNLVGSYKCHCPSGFELKFNKHECTDINECQRDLEVCRIGTVCRNTPGYYRCIPFSCPQPYFLAESDSKCVKTCPEGDLNCYQIKEKVYQFWTFRIKTQTQPRSIFSYKIVARGYKNPNIRYRIRSGNNLGHFKIEVNKNVSEVLSRIEFQAPREYVLDFVGELYDGNELVSRYVHYLYVFVSNYI